MVVGGDYFAAQKPFVSLKDALKQTLCSLLTSDMLGIASNSISSWHKEIVTGTLEILFSLGLKHAKNFNKQACCAGCRADPSRCKSTSR